MLRALAIFEEEKAMAEEKSRVIRPNVNTKKVIASKLFRLLFLVLLGFVPFWLHSFFGFFMLYGWLCCAAAMILFIAPFAKTALIDWILLYQRYAPERVRASCVFTPTCSEYMILAVNKYGTLKGFFKGVARLCRCHQPNGGIDNP